MIKCLAVLFLALPFSGFGFNDGPNRWAAVQQPAYKKSASRIVHKAPYLTYTLLPEGHSLKAPHHFRLLALKDCPQLAFLGREIHTSFFLNEYHILKLSGSPDETVQINFDYYTRVANKNYDLFRISEGEIVFPKKTYDLHITSMFPVQPSFFAIRKIEIPTDFQLHSKYIQDAQVIPVTVHALVDSTIPHLQSCYTNDFGIKQKYFVKPLDPLDRIHYGNLIRVQLPETAIGTTTSVLVIHYVTGSSVTYAAQGLFDQKTFLFQIPPGFVHLWEEGWLFDDRWRY